MNQQRYIQQLLGHLSSLSAAERVEIEQDYLAYFNDAKAAGREETEIIAALGEPGQLAGLLLAERRIQDWQQDKSLRNLVRVLAMKGSVGIFSTAVGVPVWLGILLSATVQLAAGLLALAGLLITVLALCSAMFGWPPNGGLVLNTSGVGPLLVTTHTLNERTPEINIQAQNGDYFRLQRQQDGGVRIAAAEGQKRFEVVREAGGAIRTLQVQENGDTVQLGNLGGGWPEQLLGGVFMVLLGGLFWWLARQASGVLLAFWRRHLRWVGQLGV